MTTLTAQQIACVYAWLAQLFSRELDWWRSANMFPRRR